MCNKVNNRGSTCRGNMIDAVLDWEHDLPEPFYSDSISKCKKADLSIVLGSSLQIQPGKFQFRPFQFNQVHFKANSYPSNFIFEIDVGKRRIRQTTILKLNDEFLDRLKIY